MSPWPPLEQTMWLSSVASPRPSLSVRWVRWATRETYRHIPTIQTYHSETEWKRWHTWKTLCLKRKHIKAPDSLGKKKRVWASHSWSENPQQRASKHRADSGIPLAFESKCHHRHWLSSAGYSPLPETQCKNANRSRENKSNAMWDYNNEEESLSYSRLLVRVQKMPVDTWKRYLILEKYHNTLPLKQQKYHILLIKAL